MKNPPSFRNILSSKKQKSRLVKFITYAILTSMAIVMLLPLLWLVNGSFQPSWQINANPVVWIPRAWDAVFAGDTGKELLLWWANDPAGEKQQVIQIGARRYTTTLDPGIVQTLISVPRDQLSDATPTEFDGAPLNVRIWKGSEGETQVVALARDSDNEDNLLVAPVEELVAGLGLYPLDLVNKAQREKADVAGTEMEVRLMDDGTRILAVGPESEMTVVGEPEIADNAELIQTSRLGNKEFIDVGATQLAIYNVLDKPEEYRAIAIATENWQPLLEQSLVADKAFIANVDTLSAKGEPQLFNDLSYLDVRTYTPPDGSAPYEVVVLIPGSTEYLVIPIEYMDQLYAAPISELVEPGSVNLGALTYRVQNDYEKDGVITPSALVGPIQDLSLIVPASSVTNAFDVSPDDMERSTHVKLITAGYKRVLNLKLSGVPFWRFFVNSGYIVFMNMLGHMISCTLVAYGFARFRAPGKNLLFVILLGTLMVPGTIVVLPTYIVFQKMGLLGTMVPLWIRSFFGNAFLIFVLRQFFMSIPYELDEAAILDGASRLQVLLKIIIPLSKPALATLGIFTFWWYWNAFLDPLIYINQQKYFTITLAMNTFSQQYSRSAGYYDRILAGSVLSLLPMVIIFLAAQRYFIEGIQLQGLKR